MRTRKYSHTTTCARALTQSQRRTHTNTVTTSRAHTNTITTPSQHYTTLHTHTHTHTHTNTVTTPHTHTNAVTASRAHTNTVTTPSQHQTAPHTHTQKKTVTVTTPRVRALSHSHNTVHTHEHSHNPARAHKHSHNTTTPLRGCGVARAKRPGRWDLAHHPATVTRPPWRDMCCVLHHNIIHTSECAHQSHATVLQQQRASYKHGCYVAHTGAHIFNLSTRSATHAVGY